MAIIKYKNNKGEFKLAAPLKVDNIVPVQETGSSPVEVMSQAAVTDELAKKVDTDVFDARVEGFV